MSESLDLARTVARVGDAEHASDVLVLDVGDIFGVADYFVIMNGHNRRLVRTLAERVEERARIDLGRQPTRREGVNEQQWVLLDYGDVVVHIFLDEIRRYYEIERLYADAPVVVWRPAADAPAVSEGRPDADPPTVV